MKIYIDRDGRHVYIRRFEWTKPVKAEVHDMRDEKEAMDFIRKFLTRARKKGFKLFKYDTQGLSFLLTPPDK